MEDALLLCVLRTFYVAGKWRGDYAFGSHVKLVAHGQLKNVTCSRQKAKRKGVREPNGSFIYIKLRIIGCGNYFNGDFFSHTGAKIPRVEQYRQFRRFQDT